MYDNRFCCKQGHISLVRKILFAHEILTEEFNLMLMAMRLVNIL